MKHGLWLLSILLFILMALPAAAQDSDPSAPLATMVAQPTLNANVQDNSAQLQATLAASSTQPKAPINSNAAELDGTLRANEATLAPPQPTNDLSDFLPSELRAQGLHQMLIFIALAITFALVWKLRQNTVVDLEGRKKKKKRS